MSDFNKVEIVRKCCFSILPQMYWDRLSITEQIAKIIDALNKLIENNAILEDYIKEIIQEIIESGEIETIIKNMLANYILNVKYPPEGITPAVGDGTADDTIAIQGCIDYANLHGGGCVYFPSGKYLTNTLTLKNNVALKGFDRYTTELVLKGGATASLISGNVDNTGVYDLSLDGNSGVQVNEVNVVDVNIDHSLWCNLILKDGYTLFNITQNGNLQMNNVICGDYVDYGIKLNGSGTSTINNVFLGKGSVLRGVTGLLINSNNIMAENIISVENIPNGIIVAGNNNYIKAKISNAVSNYSNTGTNNTIIIEGVSELENWTGASNSTYGGDYFKKVNGIFTLDANKANLTVATEYTSNVFKHLDYVATDRITEINGNETETIGGNFTETITGTKEITAEEIILKPTNPLTYKAPIQDSGAFKNKYIPFKDYAGNEYKVMVNTDVNVNIINVKDFGAIGDSSADDTQAFQNAINYASTITGRGRNIYIPSGVYKMTSSLIVAGNTQGISFIGDGIARSMIYRNSDYGSTIIFGEANGTGIEGVTIKDLFFYHDFGGFENGQPVETMVNKPTTGAHLWFYNPLHLVVENCNIWNMPTNITCYGGAKVHILRNSFRGVWDYAHTELQVTTANINLVKSESALTGFIVPTDYRIRDNDISGYLSPSRSVTYGAITLTQVENIGALFGIRILGAEVIQISGGNVGANQTGIGILPQNNTAMLTIEISGVFFDGNRLKAILISNANGNSTAQGVNIHDNTFIGQKNSLTAIWAGEVSSWSVASATNLDIHDNMFGSYQQSCVIILRADKVKIHNNIIRDFNTDNGYPNDYFNAVGVYLGNSNFTTVSDNSIGGGFANEDLGEYNHCYCGIYTENIQTPLSITNNVIPLSKITKSIVSIIPTDGTGYRQIINNLGFNDTTSRNVNETPSKFTTTTGIKNPHGRNAWVYITATALADVVVNGRSIYVPFTNTGGVIMTGFFLGANDTLKLSADPATITLLLFNLI